MNIICILLSCFKSSPCSGLVTTMTILCLVALGKLLANRASVNFHLLFNKSPTKPDVAQVARVERVRQILGGQLGTNMLGTAGTWADKLGTAGTWANPGQLPDKDSSAQLTQPMLAGIGNHVNRDFCLSSHFDSKFPNQDTSTPARAPGRAQRPTRARRAKAWRLLMPSFPTTTLPTTNMQEAKTKSNSNLRAPQNSSWPLSDGSRFLQSSPQSPRPLPFQGKPRTRWTKMDHVGQKLLAALIGGVVKIWSQLGTV